MHLSSALDHGRLRLLYRLLPGTADDSHGFEVAEAAGFPRATMALARGLYAQRLRAPGPGGERRAFGKADLDVTEAYVRLRSLLRRARADGAERADGPEGRAGALEGLRAGLEEGLALLGRQKL